MENKEVGPGAGLPGDMLTRAKGARAKQHRRAHGCVPAGQARQAWGRAGRRPGAPHPGEGRRPGRAQAVGCGKRLKVSQGVVTRCA